MCFSSKQQKLLQHKFKQFGSQIFLINSQIILILFNECEGLNLRTACCSSYLHKSSQLKISSFYSTLIVRQTSETCGAEFNRNIFIQLKVLEYTKHMEELYFPVLEVSKQQWRSNCLQTMWWYSPAEWSRMVETVWLLDPESITLQIPDSKYYSRGRTVCLHSNITAIFDLSHFLSQSHFFTGLL